MYSLCRQNGNVQRGRRSDRTRPKDTLWLKGKQELENLMEMVNSMFRISTPRSAISVPNNCVL